jgi:acid stress chaperone HdeB
MKLIIAALTVFAAIGVNFAYAADDIDMSTIKCKDFIASSNDEIGTIMIWLEGFYTKENDPPVLRVNKMTKDGKAMGTYCAQHGEDGLITAANAVMPVQ